jgi:hypothetical protein
MSNRSEWMEIVRPFATPQDRFRSWRAAHVLYRSTHHFLSLRTNRTSLSALPVQR